MRKIIVAIEDDPQIAELLELLLESPDLFIFKCASGREGLDCILKAQPDLIIADVKLPEMSGWEVYDAVRANERTRHTPIIMLSVSQMDINRSEAFTRSKIDFYMSKPFDLLKLRRQIRDLLDVHRWEIGDTPVQPKKDTGMLRPISDKLLGHDEPKKDQGTPQM